VSLLPVEEALARVLAAVPGAVAAEDVPLSDGAGRTLAADLAAARTQPPFPASAMDGWAVRSADTPGRLRIAGRSVAGRGADLALGPGEAVRIFTGAPVPPGADAVVIQENARAEGDAVAIPGPAKAGAFIRPAGLDFREGEVLLRAGERLDAPRLSLAGAMGHARLPVRRKARVGILATGDELVLPGEPAGPDQIVASNMFGLAAMVARAGGEAVDLGIARDTPEDLDRALGAAEAAALDILVTLGGASVGEHDLVQAGLARRGVDLGFWKVALRPGKPLMQGRLGRTLVLGLPGNPVSSIVCGILFLVPAIRALLGDPDAGADQAEPALLGADLRGNDLRQDYMRATLVPRPEGLPVATPLPVQDSSMLAALARAQALLVRAPHAPAARAGEPCRMIRLSRFA
jgi:molybdopterin molybdotransferase